MALRMEVLLNKYTINFQDNWVVNTRLQEDNSMNDLAVVDDNVNAYMVKRLVKKMVINYN